MLDAISDCKRTFEIDLLIEEKTKDGWRKTRKTVEIEAYSKREAFLHFLGQGQIGDKEFRLYNPDITPQIIENKEYCVSVHPKIGVNEAAYSNLYIIENLESLPVGCETRHQFRPWKLRFKEEEECG